jgi:hypothetical protein
MSEISLALNTVALILQGYLILKLMNRIKLLELKVRK